MAACENLTFSDRQFAEVSPAHVQSGRSWSTQVSANFPKSASGSSDLLTSYPRYEFALGDLEQIGRFQTRE
jgi:hypothetical protein